MKDCKVPVELQEFNKNKAKRDGLNTICRVCSRNKSSDYYSRNKDLQKKQIHASRQKRRQVAVKFVRDYATKMGCVDCKESDFIVLDFDHVIGKKHKAISIMLGNGASIDSLKEEIDKCVVRCANCHRRRTAKQQEWYKYLDGGEAY